MKMHNTTKKIAAINDLTGFGRCALTVTIPIVSAMGIQCCPVPTALFSNHPAYPSHFSKDLTTELPSYFSEWKKLGLTFDGILSGYLNSPEQIALTKRFIWEFSNENTKVIIDPVMGDHGRLYSVYTNEMCSAMKELCSCADILTPNLTEACILADMPFHHGDWAEAELHELMHKLLTYENKQIVVSGIPSGKFIVNMIYEDTKGISFLSHKKTSAERSGTGDIFSAILAADAVNKIPFSDSVDKAGNFIRTALISTEKHHIPSTDGVYFEPLLKQLT